MPNGVAGRIREWENRNPFRRWRKEHGITLSGACALMRVSQATVQKWEAGAAMPTDENMARITELTGNPRIADEWAAWREEGARLRVDG